MRERIRDFARSRLASPPSRFGSCGAAAGALAAPRRNAVRGASTGARSARESRVFAPARAAFEARPAASTLRCNGAKLPISLTISQSAARFQDVNSRCWARDLSSGFRNGLKCAAAARVLAKGRGWVGADGPPRSMPSRSASAALVARGSASNRLQHEDSVAESPTLGQAEQGRERDGIGTRRGSGGRRGHVARIWQKRAAAVE